MHEMSEFLKTDNRSNDNIRTKNKHTCRGSCCFGPGQSLFSTRDQIYFGVIDSANETDLYSIYLPTLGYARDIYYTGTSGKVQGITVAKDKLFFIVDANLVTAISLPTSLNPKILPNVSE